MGWRPRRQGGQGPMQDGDGELQSGPGPRGPLSKVLYMLARVVVDVVRDVIVTPCRCCNVVGLAL